MLIFLYEHLTALGIGRDPGDPMHSMYREGLAMRDALAADLARIPGGEVTFEAGQHDTAILIAPETDGVLLSLTKRFPTRLVGCSVEAVAVTADKIALAMLWQAKGIRTPATTVREPTPCEAFPVVWKPRYGCGSTDTFLLQDSFDLARASGGRKSPDESPSLSSSHQGAHAPRSPGDHMGPMILQEFVPGRAASIAFLCGPKGSVPLIPTFQNLSTDGRFQYQGGELPIPADLAERAVALGSRAVACAPGLQGYVGVDLVLGEAADGSKDYAIEINPRLTTSYVGLRTLAEFNIAEAMLAVALDRPLPASRALTWKSERIRFAPDGTVSPADPV